MRSKIDHFQQYIFLVILYLLSISRQAAYLSLQVLTYFTLLFDVVIANNLRHEHRSEINAVILSAIKQIMVHVDHSEQVVNDAIYNTFNEIRSS